MADDDATSTSTLPLTANEIITEQIRERVLACEQIANANVLVYSGPMADFTPDLFKNTIESIRNKRRHVLIWLETNGGLVESTERTANVLRHHYSRVDFVVTTYAMSAGTILVMSGDNIYMDYSATLGPIDPQIRRSGSDRYVPALGYLEQWQRLIEKSGRGELSTAELYYMVQKFDAAELYQFEQARDLSIALLEEWLAKYKFKNWKNTQSRGVKVTPAMRRERAKNIAEQLSSAKDWHSHSRGISMEVLRRKLKLIVEDLDDRPGLSNGIAEVCSLVYDFRMKMGHTAFCVAFAGGYYGHGHQI